MPTDSPAGRFVRHDLMTPEPSTALTFYTALVGWTTRPAGEGWTIAAGEATLGGCQRLDFGDDRAPYWACSVAVDDLPAAVAVATELGASTLPVPSADAGGPAAIELVDPRGAVFRLVAASEATDCGPAPGGPTPDGTFCWHQLNTPDVDSARRFYERVCGWQASELELDGMPQTVLFHLPGRPETPHASAMAMPAGLGRPAQWLPYVAAADVAATVARVGELGGHVWVPATTLPGGMGTFAVLGDPQGAMFALHGRP